MKNFLLRFVLLFFCVSVFSACFISSRSTESTGAVSNLSNAQANAENTAYQNGKTESTPQKKGEIRKVDFKNFTYQPYCAGEEAEKITVKNGEYSREKEDDRLYFNIFDVTYGDVNGDGDEDAIILSVCNTGGTGQFSEGFVYVMKNGKPDLLTRIEGGDRAYGGLRSAKVENGVLVVERNGEGEMGGACCPEFVVTTKYKLEGKNLKQVGGETKRELYPATRVSFAKGASENTSRVRVDEIKRFVIGARAGQTLFVSVDSKDISLSLVKGEADVSDGTNSFTAQLKENGDYVIQLQNSKEKPTDVSLTIEIQ